MKLLNLFLATCFVFAFTSCKNDKKEETPEMTQEEMAEIVTVEVDMIPKSDSNVNGSVIFTEEDGTVTMKGDFSGLTPGMHAIHLHESSDCSAPDGTSTGGHWNPTNEKHGKWGDSEGYHKGDIGNFEANADGTGSITFETNEWCIGCDDSNKNILGKSVIVHEGTDDYTSQPTGDAGGRVSCGGVIK